MLTCDLSENETRRLQALDRYAVLDTPPERVFDDIVARTANVLQAPMVTISLIDANRCWFKSRLGVDPPQIDRQIAFCAHVAAIDAPLVLENAGTYPQFADNPLVTEHPHVAFYAGVPLRASSGEPLGALCAMDSKPRTFPWADFESLKHLAAEVEAALEARLSVALTNDNSTKH